MDTCGLNSWIEISRGAYLHNLEFFRRLVGPRVELSAVVKANAYGHGGRLVAELAAAGGADSFCVHSLDEALDLRAAGLGHDVLIMGHVPLERAAEAVAHDFRCGLFNLASAAALAAAARDQGRRARVHLKLETGTYRQGVDDDELAAYVDFLRAHPELHLEGVYTHFANVEDTTDHAYAEHQLRRFEALVERLAAAGFGELRRHAACSAASLVVARTHFDMVRLGVSQYGLWPSKETLLSYKLQRPPGGIEGGDLRPPGGIEGGDLRPPGGIEGGDLRPPGGIEGGDLRPPGGEQILRPVLTWKTRVSQVKRVPAGAFVGYGCTYQTPRASRIAVLPIGYFDGYDRHLSNQAYVLVRGRRAPVRGRVCMNLTMVDVTDVPGVELEDEVVVLGRQGGQQVRAEDLAALVGTISYEIVARIHGDLPRFVVE